MPGTPLRDESAPVNPNNQNPVGGAVSVLPAGVTWESIVVACGGGWLPPDDIGDLSPKLLGFCLGKKDDAVRNYVEKYDLNVRTLGDEMLISPAEIRAKVPPAKWQKRKITRKK